MLTYNKSNEFTISLLTCICFNFLGTYCKKICNRKIFTGTGVLMVRHLNMNLAQGSTW